MDTFVEQFGLLVDYGMLGAYRRLSSRPDVKAGCEPALLKACAIGAMQNRRYALRDGENWVLPETEYALIEMLSHPLSEQIDALPELYAEALRGQTPYADLEPLIELDGRGGMFLSEEGNAWMGCRRMNASKDVADQMREYNGQRIFEELCNGTHEAYVWKRDFLEQPINRTIPSNIVTRKLEYGNAQAEIWRRFQEENNELFQLCYEADLTTRTDYVMRDVVRRYIYDPGQLEQQIKKLLECAYQAGTVTAYTLWPGIYEGRYDTWDFDVTCSDGRRFVIDAKDVANPHWLIWDERQYLDGADFLYVVPDDRGKTYVDCVNLHEKCVGKAQCIRLRELKKWLGVK